MEGSVTSCVERNRQGEIILESLQDMRNKKEMLDATLACDNATINVHKLVLSACSSLLRKLISNNPDSHTSIWLPGVKSGLLAPLLDFMYAGEVFVAPEDLSEFLQLAEELQVKGLPRIAPVDTVTTAESSTGYVDIKKFYQEGDDVHKNENVEPIGAQKDVNQNGMETLAYDDAKQNIYVMEAAILVNTSDNVMNTEDDNHNGNNDTNVRIEVAELVMDGKQEDERMMSQDIKLKVTEIQVENDSKAPLHQVEKDGEAKNQTYIEKENIKEQLNYTSETGSEETKVSSEEHLLIRSKIAKVGVGKNRRHLCKICDKSGTKDIIYNHIATEHAILIATEQEEKMGKEKIEEKIRQDKIITEEEIAEKCQTKKDFQEKLLEDKTSTTPKKTAAELTVEWGDDGHSDSVCEKVLTQLKILEDKTSKTPKKTYAELAVEWEDDGHSNSVCEEDVTATAMENIHPNNTELDHNNGMEYINPNNTELNHYNGMEHINPNATELNHHNGMEHINPNATELDHHNGMEHINPFGTELDNDNAMEHINPFGVESAIPIAKEQDNGIVTQYDKPNTMELVNPNPDDQDFIVKGDSEDYSDKINVDSVEEKPKQPVLKIAASHKGNFIKKSNVPSKKRKTVTFSSDGPEEFIYEREECEDNGHFKKQRIAPSDAEIVVDVNNILKLRAGGILSVSKQGFHFQDEPQKIEDLDSIQHKAICKKIVMLDKNRFKCMECGKKGQKNKMLNHIKKGKFN